MDARLVWDTWRRILTDDRLVTRVLNPDWNESNPGLSVAETAILNEYASTPAATDVNIGMYRRGLVRNALAALSLVPLSQQLLYMSGLDVDSVAANYAKADDYFDHGPNFWHIAGRFVAHLASYAEFATPSHQDVLALDASTIALAQRLGNDPDAWPILPASRARREARRFVASRAATVVTSSHDLTEWIVNPQTFDPSDTLEPTTHSWLVYFPTADAERGFAEVSERAARAFALLSRPYTAAELSSALDGIPIADALKIISSLAALGVVAEVGAEPTIENDCHKLARARPSILTRNVSQ